MCSSDLEPFLDIRWGAQFQDPSEQCGDVLAMDRDGNWTYQFAAAVDDFLQDVTLVIRGDDLLPSVGRQLRLARLLGREQAPRFFHHPLLRKSSGAKLSKSDGDTAIRDLRARGVTPAVLIGRAAFAGGLLDVDRPVPAAEVSALPAIVAWRDRVYATADHAGAPA